jgi:hypothetical protein
VSLKLYKIEAYFAGSSETYYVVANHAVEAEDKIGEFHKEHNWARIDFCDFSVLAQQSSYGKPAVLLATEIP